MKKTSCLLIAVCGVFTLACFVTLPAFGDEFYQGKTLRFIVGYAPGGGYDTYTRAIARHIGKFIPGNPTAVVENMEGAGSLLAANYMFNKAEPDGLTVGDFNSGMVTQQALDAKGIRFDARKFGWIGAPGKGWPTCMVMGFTGLKTLDDVLKAGDKLRFGGTRAGASSDDLPKLMDTLMGTHLRVISGYKGTGPVRLAFNAGEVNGVCNSLESFKATWRNEMDKGEVVLIVQGNLKPHPDIPHVPWAPDLAKTEEARKMILTSARVGGILNRFYVLPPGTPTDRVLLLRKAFMDTLKDPEFLTDAGRAKLDLDPIDGLEIQKQVKELFSLEPALVKKMKEILK